MTTVQLSKPTTLTSVLAGSTPNPSAREALKSYNEFRLSLGSGKVSRGSALLTPPDANMKFAKTTRPIFGLSLAPHRDAVRVLGEELLGDLNVCPWSTPSCREGCVAFAGNGEFHKVQRARAIKTAFAATRPADFLSILIDEIEGAARKDPDGAIRLNTFSDVAWERILPEAVFHLLPAYDYTKGGIKRFRAGREVGYRLVLSVSERTNLSSMDSWLSEGATAAVVFPHRRGEDLPRTFRGHPVIDGDKTDDRLIDPPGSVIGLRAKGRLNNVANRDSRNFIRGTKEDS